MGVARNPNQPDKQSPFTKFLNDLAGKIDEAVEQSRSDDVWTENLFVVGIRTQLQDLSRKTKDKAEYISYRRERTARRIE